MALLMEVMLEVMLMVVIMYRGDGMLVHLQEVLNLELQVKQSLQVILGITKLLALRFLNGQVLVVQVK